MENIGRRKREFREWYTKFDSDAWDEQIRNDAASGKLDSLAGVASAEHKGEKSRQF